MKKSLVLALVLSMVLALTACGKSNAEENANATSEQTETVDTAADTAADTTDAADVEATDDTAADTAEDAADGVMSYDEYMAAAIDSEVVIEAYVQATQSWWEGTINVYAMDENGGYFIYNMACAEEDAPKLADGQKIKVTGFKSEWSGEVEITDATFEFAGDDKYVAEAVDLTDKFGTDDIANFMNQYFAFTDMTVEASTDADGNEAAFLYNWDGSGEEGSDLYFNVSVDGKTYTFTVESYLCGPGTDVYEAVKALNVGDVISGKGFLYWYEGPNPHITEVVAK